MSERSKKVRMGTGGEGLENKKKGLEQKKQYLDYMVMCLNLIWMM